MRMYVCYKPYENNNTIKFAYYVSKFRLVCEINTSILDNIILHIFRNKGNFNLMVTITKQVSIGAKKLKRINLYYILLYL